MKKEKQERMNERRKESKYEKRGLNE